MTDADRPAFAVITGGGTSGHVLPALAIADGLVEAGHDPATIRYVGSKRGIETRLVPPTGFPYTFLDVIGLQRRLELSNLLFPIKLARAVWTAFRLIGRWRPRVIVTLGGYASLPSVVAGRLRRVPILVVAYDKRPGQSSRIAARFAVASAVAFPGSSLPRSRLTGSPLRTEVLAVDRQADRSAARAALGLPEDRFVVAVIGGSLGSGVINPVVSDLVERCAERRDLAVRHVVGQRFFDDASPARDGATGILYQVIGYEDRMPMVYAAADLVVARAGAGTVAELATIGVPSILVPWAGAAEDHQTDNARTLEVAGAAVVIPESELTSDRLLAEIEALRADPALLERMAACARAEGAIHRSGSLVRLVEEVAGR